LADGFADTNRREAPYEHDGDPWWRSEWHGERRRRRPEASGVTVSAVAARVLPADAPRMAAPGRGCALPVLGMKATG
jgi:hypothetical protein